MTEGIVKRLNETFPEFKISHKVENYRGKVHLFFIECLNEKEIDQKWEELGSWIAGNFQTKLETEFEMWNLYLFYIIPSSIDPKLKYMIENDTFSSRKIVIEGEIGYEEIIKEHITNTDLDLGNIIQIPSGNDEIKKDPDLEKILKGKILKDKRRTQEVPFVFNQLVDLIKSSEDEV